MCAYMRTSLLVAALFMHGEAIFAQVPSGTGYHQAYETVLGGEGGWDYLTLDASGVRLYISRSTHVSVVDPESRKEVGTIPDTPGVHGIALAPELGRGYTSNGRDATVTVFDLRTLRQLSRISVGTNPDAIVYEPATRRVFTFNGASHDASVIDAATGVLAHTLPLGGKPEFAVADGQGHIFVNIEDTSELVEIDANGPRIAARWPLAPCEEPTGLAIDVLGRHLFVGCSNRLMAIVDARQGGVLATLPIGAGCDATAFDASSGFAFAANGDGSLTVIRENGPGKFGVVENVKTKAGARTMALDSQRQRIYLVTAEYGPKPPATSDKPNPRPPIIPGSFTMLTLTR
jgi:DNA-binding beta-propeller fold protein YncE